MMSVSKHQMTAGALVLGAALAFGPEAAFAFGGHSSGSHGSSMSSAMPSGLGSGGLGSGGVGMPAAGQIAGQRFVGGMPNTMPGGMPRLPLTTVPGTAVGMAPNGTPGITQGGTPKSPVTTVPGTTVGAAPGAMPGVTRGAAPNTKPATAMPQPTPSAATSTMSNAKLSSTAAAAKQPTTFPCDPTTPACAKDIANAIDAAALPTPPPPPAPVPAPAQQPEPRAITETAVAAPTADPPLVTETTGGGSMVNLGGGAGTLAECMAIWDRSTDMSKAEWRDTCSRTLNGMDLPAIGLGDTPAVHHASHTTGRTAGHHARSGRPSASAAAQ